MSLHVVHRTHRSPTTFARGGGTYLVPLERPPRVIGSVRKVCRRVWRPPKRT